jgi:hypothetical protein
VAEVPVLLRDGERSKVVRQPARGYRTSGKLHAKLTG